MIIHGTKSVDRTVVSKNELFWTDLEYDVELGVEIRLKALPLQDRLKLVQKLERVFDRGDVLEALVDKRLRQNTRTNSISARLQVIPPNVAKADTWWTAQQLHKQ